MAEATLLDPQPWDTIKILLPRGVVIVSSAPHGGATRYVISGKDLTEGKGYQLVSTDGPLLRCIELVENDFEEDQLGAQRQPRRAPNG